MRPKYRSERQYMRKYYRSLIGRGEISAHNNSIKLKHELKKILSELKWMRV